MRINCLSCGFKVELDDAYDDFEGPIKCLCGAMLEIRTKRACSRVSRLAEPLSRPAAQPKGTEGGGTP